MTGRLAGRVAIVIEAARGIGHACVFLASEQAAHVTGTTILLAGGQILPEAML